MSLQESKALLLTMQKYKKKSEYHIKNKKNLTTQTEVFLQ